MGAPCILIVDDEPELCQIVERCCRAEGCEPVSVHDGDAALALASSHTVDLIVLDIMLGDLDGFDVLRRLREQGQRMPVVFLSARTEETDKIIGLGLGADDFVTKPFSPRELGARIKAHLRRSRQAGADAAENRLVRRGPLCLDSQAMTVSLDGAPLGLTSTELKLLAWLMEHPHQVFTRRQLYQAIWGDAFMDDNTIPVYICRLREKIGDDSRNPGIIETVRGIGYRFAVG
jgi:DNA-binding response OmpR family regulator